MFGLEARTRSSAAVGADALDGGADFDFASYATATSGVIASLAAPALNAGEAAGDSFASIEGLIGFAFNDVLVCDANANILIGNGAADVLSGLDNNDRLLGGAGNDLLFGGNGDDTLDGGAGADLLTGGAGFDLASYERSSTEGVVASARKSGGQHR